MKKIFILLLTIMLCTGLLFACEATKSENDMPPIYFLEKWDETSETWGIYKKPVVNDADTALGIAKAVFAGMDKSTEMQEHKPICVDYYEEDEVWVVCFAEISKDPNVAILGGGCCIAIQKSDGKVLKIWFGE